jgi:hypothetical protein
MMTLPYHLARAARSAFRRHGRAPRRPAKCQFRPQLQRLEERCVPAVYNNAAQFSATSDPQGEWSYGYLAPPATPETPDASTFTLYPNHGHVQDAVVDYWWTNIGNADPQVNHNPTSVTQTYVSILWQPNQAAFHPGPHGEYGDYRFTAPAGGFYAITATFTGIDQHGSAAKDVHVLENGTELYNVSLPGSYGSTVTYSATVGLVKGTLVDFVVG